MLKSNELEQIIFGIKIKIFFTDQKIMNHIKKEETEFRVKDKLLWESQSIHQDFII